MTTAGHVVAGRYRLVRRLGEGGMGAVWVAEDVKLHSQVAIKLLHGGQQTSEEGLKRFLREAQAAARLRSPHVVQIIEHGVDDGVPFIAMELLEGESLATRLERLGTLPLAQTARIVTHVARAIGKAHDAGIVHRDLKPDNVFIVHNDDEEIVKVLDFGIAKMDRQLSENATNVSTEAGALLGTPHYMSPEQVRGRGVDFRSDLWSLAMIVYECVCGRLPFEGGTVGDVLVLICSEPIPPPSTLAPLPPAFDAWFAKATMRKPDERFQSAKEMAESLRALVGDESYTPDPSASGRVRRIREDAATLDVDSVRELGRARTVSAGGTMGGAAAAVRGSSSRKPWAVLGGVVVLAIVGVAAWIGLHTRGAARPTAAATISVASERPAPPRPSAIAVVAPATSVAIVASASASPSAVASVAPAASATHAPKKPHAPAATKTDELAF